MIRNFQIQETRLKINTDNLNKKKFVISSFPRSYEVEFNEDKSKFIKTINSNSSVTLIDKNIYNLYFSKHKIKNKKIFKIESYEKNKNLKTIEKILKFFVKNNISKSNKIYAIGGGIIQDLAGYSCSIYKRGLYWEYIPTTFLGMTDSCVGGKVGINFGEAKNLAALFSAPRKVKIDVTYLNSLSKEDLLSGLGEALRLHLTGGNHFVKKFSENIDGAIKFNKKNLLNIIKNSLLVKKAVVEKDEYEFDIRRSMNFGHSFGHALEVLCNHSIAHGKAVTIGMCVEILLCQKKFKIQKKVYEQTLPLALKLLTKKDHKNLKKANLKNLNNIMQKDKKTLKGVIKFTVPKKIGFIKFFDQKLDKNNMDEVIWANKIFIKALDGKKNSN